MALVRSVFLLLWFVPPLFAQQLSHPVLAARDDVSRAARVAAGPDTIRVLALRVQFQADADTRTSGNGQFDLTAGADSTFDAPPHDAQYFRDHLTFLANYFRKTSRGRVTIQSTLLDSVVTLPAGMAAYSPPKAGPNTAVANLARDSWRAVDSLGLVPDFRRFDCFILFHAGAGRDVDLVSALGYDPTPSDIPSLFFGLKGFRQVYGDSYQGIPVAGGSVYITNTVILPETERRVLPDGSLLLGINGLLCASFGNFLGLPDLFDTNTGRSGIGRFGLMDGQAIFSFAGLFPPEPSAWEKYWLGWIEPVTVPSTPSTVALPAVGFGTIDPARSDTIYRVPINGSEYFLLENRNRDPGQDGMRVWQSFRGSPRVLSVRHDTAGFTAIPSLDLSRIVGVVTDVEDFDWSLPGGLDADGVFYDGGVLVWHIDESVIRSTIAADAVNANPLRRGVDLEEADGSQDIGQQYDQFSPAAGSEEGTAFDFWYRGNSAPIYRNEFSPTSIPATTSNNGGNSQITIGNFSDRGPRMAASVRIGAGAVRPLPGFPKQTGETLTTVPIAVGVAAGGDAAIVVGTTGRPAPVPRADSSQPAFNGRPKVLAWSQDGREFVSGGLASGLVDTAAPGTMAGGLALADVDRDGTLDVVRGYSAASGSGLLRAVSLSPGSDGLGRRFLEAAGQVAPSASAGVADSLLTFLAAGKLYLFDRAGAFVDSVGLPGDSIAGVTQLPSPYSFALAGSRGTILLTARGRRGSTVPDNGRNFGRQLNGPVAIAPMGIGGSTDYGFALTSADGEVYLLDGRLNIMAGFPVDLQEETEFPPVLADIDGDGSREIVVAAGSHLHALSRIGVEMDGFPVSIPSGVASTPIVADIDADGSPDIVVVSTDGLVVGVDRRGKKLSGFPLSAGRGRQWPAAFLVGDSVCLAVASSDDGSVSAWRTGGGARATGAGSLTALLPWPQYEHDPARTGFDGAVLPPGSLTNEFFPPSRAYNWPNPAYGGITHIRYFVNEDAGITITIFDLAGDLVAKYSQNGVGGMDNEFPWNVSAIQSGVYFARIEARNARQTGATILKIAVVK